MPTVGPSELRARVAEANRVYYEQTAVRYEASETCVHDEGMQAGLQSDLHNILQLLGIGERALHCLDACAGTGTVTLKLLRYPKVSVEACDISPEMLGMLQAKARSQGVAPTLHQAELVAFLQRPDPLFDLIVFSSALHHLEDYTAVLQLCRSRLRPGGMVFTTFDPTLTRDISRPGRALVFIDYAAFKLIHQTSDAPAALIRRIRRTLLGGGDPRLTNDNVGVVAEYHAPDGIDDKALVARMLVSGYRVLWHERRSSGRSRFVRTLLGVLGDVTSFKLLLEKT